MAEGNNNNVVFACDECVICLADGATPNTLFCPCRHRCCCRACGELVEKAKQPCPLCRALIAEVLYYADHAAASDVVIPVEADAVRVFKEERREQYVKALRAPVTSDACFRGRGKLARSVASEVCDELEQRRRETAGTERVTAKRATIQFALQGHDLCVDYKVGRAKRHEQHALLTLEEARDALVEALGGDRVTLLDVATHYPDYYWVLRYHLGLEHSMEEYLGGVLQQQQRKRSNNN